MNAPLQVRSAMPHPARRTLRVTGSIIREILKVAQRPDMISLAGGLPAPESFPVEALRAAFDAELRDDGKAALQYSTTEGHAPLREWIAARESAAGAATAPEEVLIVSGSQQGLDLIGKAFAEPGSALLVEAPTYLGALHAFSVFEPDFRTLPSDSEGVDPAQLDSNTAGTARLLYMMPNFQNPSGRTLTAQRRAELAEAARRHDLWLIEDDPYGELWYEQAPPPGLRAIAPERTIRLGSFSKVLAPGLRLGYVIAPRDCIDLLVRLKQATDLHSSTLTQRAVWRVLASGVLEHHLPRVRALYAVQCRTMLDSLTACMPTAVSWTQPAGGMFVWLTLPPSIDAAALLPIAIERNVAFVPGEPFFASAPARNTLRLSFATVPAPRIRQAVAILADLIRMHIGH